LGLADHWEKRTSRAVIFAKFGVRAAVTILRHSVQTEFRILSARERWKGRKFENRPTLTARISEPGVDRRSQKSPQVGPDVTSSSILVLRSCDSSPAHKKIRRENLSLAILIKLHTCSLGKWIFNLDCVEF